MPKYLLSFLLIFQGWSLQAQTMLDTAPDFSAKDIHGVMHYLYPTLDSNNFVLLDFFTTTCGPCVTYAPEIQQAYVHFGSNQANVRFLGINYADDNAGVSLFDSLYGITFPTVSGNNGHGNTVALDVFEVQGFPTMVFIAPNHLILNQQIFPPSFNNLDSTLTASMGQYTSLNENAQENQGFSITGVYPNPASGALNLRLETQRPLQFSYEILTGTAQPVLQERFVRFDKGWHTISIDTKNLIPGIYFVRLSDGHGIVASKKFIVL